MPRYYSLFTQISRLDNGVKFLASLRSDVIVSSFSIAYVPPIPPSQNGGEYAMFAVGLFVCEQDNSKSCGLILTRFSRSMNFGKEQND